MRAARRVISVCPNPKSKFEIRNSHELAGFDFHVLAHELGGHAFLVEQVEADAAALEDFLELAQGVPLEVASEFSIKVVDAARAGAGEERGGAGGGEHIHEDEVLAPDEVDAVGEALGEHRVVEGGEDDEEGALAEAEADEGADFLKVGGDGAGLEGEQGVAAGVVVGFAAAGADEFFHAIAEGEDAEQVALALGGDAEDEGGGDEALEHGGLAGGSGFEDGAGAEAGGVEDHIDLLGALDLEDFGDGMAALGGGFPVDFVVAVAGDVLAEFLEFAAFADLPAGVDAGVAAVEEQGGDVFALVEEVRIDAELGGDGLAGASGPEAEGGGRLEVDLVEGILTAASGAAGPGEAGKRGADRGGEVFVFARDLGREREAEAERARGLAFVVNEDVDGAVAVFLQPDDFGDFDAEAGDGAGGGESVAEDDEEKKRDGCGGGDEQAGERASDSCEREDDEGGPEDEACAGSDQRRLRVEC